MPHDIIRTCVFSPYRNGPRFRLRVWDTHNTDSYGKSVLGYRLELTTGKTHPWTIFEGEDFHCSPMYAIDSDEAIAGIMGFLTLRPGDTDKEYFEAYTPEQLDYCSEHAEALASEVYSRFGQD